MTDERVAEPPDEAGTTAGGGRPLRVSPIIVLDGPPDAVDEVAGPSPARRRRTGTALLTATGIAVLAAAPFAVVSPTERVLGDSVASSAKARPHGPVTERTAARPAVPAPAPTWQPRSSSPPPSLPPVPKAKIPSPSPSERSAPPRTSPRTRPRTDSRTTPGPGSSANAAVRRALAPKPKDTAAPRRSASTERAAAEGQTRVVHGTYVLYPGDEIRTNRLRLSLTSGGDLVLRDRNDERVWSSGTHASGTHAVFQADGNFVLYGGDQRTLWSSRTDGHDGAVLVLQADGDLTIVQDGRVLWATGTGT
ncbi:hypothetical protein [Actinoallomurus iriomotensis]|uniref:Bulb-type lectin domain-containing protein n=1 Tax=Actinoallomurus iriomotensis TaxID=478107 RepID=A0A9W6RQJ6_9ACTN|nr:hypothetical protein [Actinoallomurus iriomotensis]GLY79769.1 hypothetical protein Airi01_080360 [Actinoallomurus iriomotensis]